MPLSAFVEEMVSVARLDQLVLADTLVGKLSIILAELFHAVCLGAVLKDN